MHKSTAVKGAAVAILIALALPGASEAHRYHHYRHYDHRCAGGRRHTANNGTVIGAVGGGLAGNMLSGGGGKLGGALIGAGVGAVAGHQIAKHNYHCR
jgi:hypothetical protein